MKYRVRRQDDNGHVFNASMWYEDLATAAAIKRELERQPHRQMYWIEDEEGQRVTEEVVKDWLQHAPVS
jgi:hypothetical protein